MTREFAMNLDDIREYLMNVCDENFKSYGVLSADLAPTVHSDSDVFYILNSIITIENELWLEYPKSQMKIFTEESWLFALIQLYDDACGYFDDQVISIATIEITKDSTWSFLYKIILDLNSFLEGTACRIRT